MNGQNEEVWVSLSPTVLWEEKSYHRNIKCRHFQRVKSYYKGLLPLNEVIAAGAHPCFVCANEEYHKHTRWERRE